MVRNYSNSIVTVVKTVASYIILELSSYIKFSFIVGSKRLFFSGINITGPLLGHYSGFGSFFAMFLRKKISSLYSLASFFGYGVFSPLVYYIPTIIASGYWFGTNRLIRLGVPLVCMAFFIAHPIGREAFLYSAFWLIPMVIHCIPTQRAFTEALGTTFTAHAVGSVLMLYTNPMVPGCWLGLMPVVVVERLFFASGMTIVFYGAQWASNLWHINKNSILGLMGVTKKI